MQTRYVIFKPFYWVARSGTPIQHFPFSGGIKRLPRYGIHGCFGEVQLEDHGRGGVSGGGSGVTCELKEGISRVTEGVC